MTEKEVSRGDTVLEEKATALVGALVIASAFMKEEPVRGGDRRKERRDGSDAGRKEWSKEGRQDGRQEGRQERMTEGGRNE